MLSHRLSGVGLALGVIFCNFRTRGDDLVEQFRHVNKHVGNDHNLLIFFRTVRDFDAAQLLNQTSFDFTRQKQRVREVNRNLYRLPGSIDKLAEREHVSRPCDGDCNRVNVDPFDVAENELESFVVGSFRIVLEEVSGSGPEETSRTAAWIKHRFESMLRQKLSDDAFTKPVRSVVLTEVVSVLRINQLLVNTFAHTFPNLLQI